MDLLQDYASNSEAWKKRRGVRHVQCTCTRARTHTRQHTHGNTWYSMLSPGACEFKENNGDVAKQRSYAQSRGLVPSQIYLCQVECGLL